MLKIKFEADIVDMRLYSNIPLHPEAQKKIKETNDDFETRSKTYIRSRLLSQVSKQLIKQDLIKIEEKKSDLKEPHINYSTEFYLMSKREYNDCFAVFEQLEFILNNEFRDDSWLQKIHYIKKLKSLLTEVQQDEPAIEK